MVKVRIYGAGSIGNHLAYACRNKGWDVVIYDIDPQALERTKNDIYPTRYGVWDEEIQLKTTNETDTEPFDLAIIGTPPENHIPIGLDILSKSDPKVILIEKPLCPPSLEGCIELQKMASSRGIDVLVGYNHTLTQNTKKAEAFLQQHNIGECQTISARFREHWGGIFGAHPWLSGPEESYLGFSKRGGGASGEHSHAINIWQHFSHLLDMGRIIEVSAMLNQVQNESVSYDNICQLHVRTEKGLAGVIVQDVITEPAQKSLRVQGSEGFLEWCVNWDEDHDALRYQVKNSEIQELLFEKSRPDDFQGEIDHIENILKGEKLQSSISLERGLDTMMVIAAVHKSNAEKRTVLIDYDRGVTPDAIV